MMMRISDGRRLIDVCILVEKSRWNEVQAHSMRDELMMVMVK